MLEKPLVSDASILTVMREAYALHPMELAFLPLGADPNTAVYRLKDAAQGEFFLKLRLGNFAHFCIELPLYLREQGVEGILAPIPAADGKPWAALGEMRLILYPYVDGQDGYEISLRDEDWRTLGRIVRQVHELRLPERLRDQIEVEHYSKRYRESLRGLMAKLSERESGDKLISTLRAYLHAHQETVMWLLNQSERLAEILSRTSLELVLCHADLHAGNVFIDRHDRRMYIIDWDDPLLAPRERDLMFPGGAQGFLGHTPEQEGSLFYEGYGEIQVNQDALMYYRVERVVTDIAIFGEVIINPNETPGNRELAFKYLSSNFLPGGTIERAIAL